MEDADWGIHYLVVDTWNWRLGRKILVSPRSIKDIDWTNRRVDLSVARQWVNGAPTYDASTAVDRAYVNHYDYDSANNRLIRLSDWSCYQLRFPLSIAMCTPTSASSSVLTRTREAAGRRTII